MKSFELPRLRSGTKTYFRPRRLRGTHSGKSAQIKLRGKANGMIPASRLDPRSAGKPLPDRQSDGSTRLALRPDIGSYYRARNLVAPVVVSYGPLRFGSRMPALPEVVESKELWLAEIAAPISKTLTIRKLAPVNTAGGARLINISATGFTVEPVAYSSRAHCAGQTHPEIACPKQ